MELKPGLRLTSQVGDTEVVVVKGSGDRLLTCGGAPLVGLGESPADGVAVDPDLSEVTLLGKRYTDPAGEVELLCTKPGPGTLALDGQALGLKEAKALPASD